MTLLERFEATTGQSRQLDAEIWALEKGWDYPECFHEGSSSFRTYRHHAPHYTGSIDAALSWMLDGWEYELTTIYGVARATLPLNDSTVDPATGDRNDGHMPLAICIAICKARGIE